MSDAVADALRKVRASKIQVRLSESQVVSGVPESGLWPRVTIEIPGKSRTFPLTEWGLQKKEAKKGELDDIEREVMVLVSGSSRTTLGRAGRKQELIDAVSRVRASIRRAVAKAAEKGSTAERHVQAQRRHRKGVFLKKFREFCEVQGRGLEYEDIRPAELGRVWDDVRRLKVASGVMDS